MAVYNLPKASPHCVVLTGDIDPVLEFSEILQKAEIPYFYIPRFGDMDELLDEDETDILYGASAESLVRYAPLMEKLPDFAALSSIRASHVVELTISNIDDREENLRIAADLYPEATFLVSTLTTTATELGNMFGIQNRTVGTGLTSGLIGIATTTEIAGSLLTTPNHIQHAASLLSDCGYNVEVVEDRMALVQMRVLVTLINEAAFALMEGVASAEDIDNAMTLGVNYPKGLLRWADEIGLDVVCTVLDALYGEYNQERYRPCVLLKQYIRAGWFGKRSGRGFYTYNS